jgi:hypothetical protein
MLGLFAALTYVRLVIEYFHMVLPHGGFTATVYCDSKAALQRAQDIEFALSTRLALQSYIVCKL